MIDIHRTQLAKWRAKGLAPLGLEGEKLFEFIFRAVLGPDADPDDIIQHGSEALFADYRDESEQPGLYAIYIPEGSHWRDVSVDPAAADLPGGNRLAENVSDQEALSVTDPVFHQRNQYRDALADIHAILYHEGPDTEWSVGMLEDIAAILARTGVVHHNPPRYYNH